MYGRRSLIQVALIPVLGIGGSFALSGCGSSESGPASVTAEQQAEKAARDKETADAFKDSQKNKKKGGSAPKGGRTSTGISTS